MILSGEKREEYREVKEYWTTRLLNKGYTHVKFYNGGHFKDTIPWMLIHLQGIRKWYGNPHWGAIKHKEYYILDLGTIIDKGNIK